MFSGALKVLWAPGTVLTVPNEEIDPSHYGAWPLMHTVSDNYYGYLKNNNRKTDT